MSVWVSEADGWVHQQGGDGGAAEADEVARDAALLRMLGLFSVVMLVVLSLIGRVVLSG